MKSFYDSQNHDCIHLPVSLTTETFQSRRSTEGEELLDERQELNSRHLYLQPTAAIG